MKFSKKHVKQFTKVTAVSARITAKPLQQSLKKFKSMQYSKLLHLVERTLEKHAVFTLSDFLDSSA